MAVIHVLDKHTAELIAAGEVVERPSSVVKELCENAVDAGATNICVEIERGGISLIRVSDNGSGIDAEYIPTAFIRHATSKIRTASDLDSIETLGFRGEALASIASVARVELLTKTEVDEFACLYRIEGGQERDVEAAARGVGTTITVRDLFYNTPARMKFLKKDTSEGNYVSEVVLRMALSHPEVSFRFLRDRKQQFQTPGDGSVRGAAYAVLGREFTHDFTEVDFDDGTYRVSGLVTPPRISRASRSMQFFFINGRFVKNRTMMAALEAAYKGAMMQGKFPGCVLFLSMPPQLVDVNVHPAKTEVRFAKEKEVFDAVYRAVKGVLFQPQNTERVMTFRTPEKPAVHTPVAPAVPAPAVPRTPPVRVIQPQPEKTEKREIHAFRDLAQTLHSSDAPVPYRTQWDNDSETANAVQSARFGPKNDEAVQHTQKEELPASDVSAADAKPLYDAPETPKEREQLPEQEPVQLSLTGQTEPEAPQLRYVGEVFDTYIIAQRGTDVCFIDKHAAHERAIYERLAADYGNVSSQMLLAPVTVRLSAEEKDALLQHASILEASGVEAEDFGGTSVIVRAVPADVVPESVEDLVVDLVKRFLENPRETVSERTEWVLHSIACRAAIKGGDKTHAQHLIRLAQDVLDGRIPPFCPHGRPIVLKVTKKELEKQFGRQG